MIAVAALALVAGGSTACATKKYVTTQVGQVSGKVDSLGKSLEDTQQRTKQNEARISEVDQKAGAAQGAAEQAGQAAAAADTKAVAATDAAKAADAKADSVKSYVDTKTNRMVYEVSLSEEDGNFKFGKSVLPDEAKASIDALMSKLLADPKGAYFEIEGHTDNVGDKAVNEKLGMARAETVKKYLYDQYKIPLHRMNVISYGEEKPVADNKTKEGRAQNRRVVIRFLVLRRLLDEDWQTVTPPPLASV
jgi:outer membrane protein OmpA-like peptidoglycan-associated protein